MQLKKSVDEEYSKEFYMSSETENENEENDLLKSCKTYKDCTVCCYNVLTKYNIYVNAYPSLAMAYQYLLTLPGTQVAHERLFSTLK